MKTKRDMFAEFFCGLGCFIMLMAFALFVVWAIAPQ